MAAAVAVAAAGGEVAAKGKPASAGGCAAKASIDCALAAGGGRRAGVAQVGKPFPLSRSLSPSPLFSLTSLCSSPSSSLYTCFLSLPLSTHRLLSFLPLSLCGVVYESVYLSGSISRSLHPLSLFPRRSPLRARTDKFCCSISHTLDKGTEARLRGWTLPYQL